jgi:hypothetical protein
MLPTARRGVCAIEAKANILQYLEQLQYHRDFDMTETASSIIRPPRDRRLLVLPLTLALVAGILAGCTRKEADSPPVATPSLTLERNRVAIGSPIRMTYRFQVAPDAKIDGDYTVFVHVLDPEGEQLWTDDHAPSVPTSKWKPGDTVEYTRTVFVPNYPYIGEAHVRLGLYQQDRRLALAGQEISRREYLVSTFQLLPQSENIFLIYKDGWHPAEVAADNPASEWQWTTKRATVSFRNPRKPATLYLEYDTRSDLFTPPQQVTLRVGEQVVGTFGADARNRTLLTFPVSAEQFGSGEMAELAIEVDRTFTPGAGDTRELGIRLFHVFVEPRS